LSNNFRRFSCTYGGACPALGAGNGLLYTNTPILTATPNAIASINVGDAIPNLVGYAYTLSGYLGSDSSVDNVTGPLTGSTTYTTLSTAGTYNIDYSSGSLASAMGYGFSYGNNASAFTASGVAPPIPPTPTPSTPPTSMPNTVEQRTQSPYGTDEQNSTADESVDELYVIEGNDKAENIDDLDLVDNKKKKNKKKASNKPLFEISSELSQLMGLQDI